MEEIKENIRTVWAEINEEFNLPNALVSSEKSLIFKFAWKYYERFGETIQSIDFETCLFEDFPDGKFLDLYIVLNHNGIEFKIGIEFKFPKRTTTNSNHPQTRQKIINDLKRINILVQDNLINLGCFLCLTNEHNYLNQGRFTFVPDCLTNHGMTYRAGELLPQTHNFNSQVKTTNDINFIWSDIHLVRNKYRINPGTTYTSIQPIFVNL
jgi:hypothetical protein